jgi:hypothetical protein
MLMAPTSQNYSSQKIPPVYQSTEQRLHCMTSRSHNSRCFDVVFAQRETFNFITYELAEIALVFLLSVKKQSSPWTVFLYINRCHEILCINGLCGGRSIYHSVFLIIIKHISKILQFFGSVTFLLQNLGPIHFENFKNILCKGLC